MCSFAAVKYKGFLLVVVLFYGASLHAQILDDSSKLVYGPKSTLRFTQSAIMINQLDTLPVDTSLYNLEKFTFTDRLLGTFQDLGNIGTALQPLYYQAPSFSGMRSGYHAYDPIANRSDDITYFDTKSPFIDLQVVLGGQGRSVIDVLYTQNVNASWNIGLSVNRLNIDKQLGAVLNEGDRNLESSQLNFFTHFQHPKRPYKVMGYFNHFNHQVREVGGVYYTDSASTGEIFQYRDASILLDEATGADTRQDLHLFQSYGFFDFFQVYHQFDLNRQQTRYADFADNAGALPYDTYEDFYREFFIDPDSTYQRLNFRSVQNELGIKGGAGAVFYRFYAKQRQITYDWLYLNQRDPVNEFYLGGLTKFNWRDLFAITARGELLNTGGYLLEGNLSSKLIEVSYRSQLYQPTVQQNRYFGNHYEWDNSFTSTFSNELKGTVNLKLGNFSLSPEANFTTLNNLVYFDTLALPSQTEGTLLISRFGLSANYKLLTSAAENEGFVFENSGYFTEVTGEDQAAFPVPQWLINSRWYWEGKWFQNAIPIQIGFNFHFKSGYFGRAYRPETQQFHVQNDDFMDAYFTIDPFISMKVNRVFVFAKMTHANMPVAGGYFITPRYPGQERIFDFGVRWIFFD